MVRRIRGFAFYSLLAGRPVTRPVMSETTLHKLESCILQVAALIRAIHVCNSLAIYATDGDSRDVCHNVIYPRSSSIVILTSVR